MQNKFGGDGRRRLVFILTERQKKTKEKERELEKITGKQVEVTEGKTDQQEKWTTEKNGNMKGAAID